MFKALNETLAACQRRDPAARSKPEILPLYQGVTLGGTGKDQDRRRSTIGNNVLISCGAKVLGPFKVGDNALSARLDLVEKLLDDQFFIKKEVKENAV